jgi:hypothetical protein
MGLGPFQTGQTMLALEWDTRYFLCSHTQVVSSKDHLHKENEKHTRLPSLNKENLVAMNELETFPFVEKN